MKVGVLSDTHLSDPSGLWQKATQRVRNAKTVDDLEQVLAQYFHDVDAILHAGDLVEMAVLERLQRLTPVVAVHGNMDTEGVRAELPAQRILEWESVRIGLTHGSGAPQGIVRRVLAQFEGEPLDAVVFGHSHQPLNERHAGVLCFNPGSPTDRIFAPYNSIGLLDIRDGSVTGTIIRV